MRVWRGIRITVLVRGRRLDFEEFRHVDYENEQAKK
jgi:hypothetical protein